MEVEKNGKPRRTIYEFADATHSHFIQFEMWKMETDLYEIELYGRTIPIRQVNFLEWLEWQRTDTLPTIENVDITLNAEYEEVK